MAATVHEELLHVYFLLYKMKFNTTVHKNELHTNMHYESYLLY